MNDRLSLDTLAERGSLADGSSRTGAKKAYAFNSDASIGSEAAALLVQASPHGRFNARTLAFLIVHLTPLQQREVLPVISARLTPFQHGDVIHVLNGMKKEIMPSVAEQEAAYNLEQAGYMRGSDGKLQLTSARARQACIDYHKMMRSNSQIAQIVGDPLSGATVTAIFTRKLDAALGSKQGKSLAVMGAIAGLTTSALSFSPTPPGCI